MPDNTGPDYDAVIIGAGHNGLVTANYRARAGKRVLVLEAREVVGGACVTEELIPGSKWSSCAFIAGLLRPEIIAELEQTARGAYTGAFGWLNRDGDLDLNILIRTAEVADTRAAFRTGAGIVADSVPDRELDETRAKARGVLRALEG